MTKVAIAIFIVAFFLLRPYALQFNGMWYSGDDQDYFAHSSAIVFGEFPSYKKEYLTIDKEYPQSSIGCALLVLPFVEVFSLIDRWVGSSIVWQRNSNNIQGSWSQFGFVLGSYFYFVLAVFLLYQGLRYHFQERHAFLSVILTVLCQGLPLFALRRPIFSHSVEFFIQSLFVFVFLRNCISERKYPDQLWHYLMLGCLSALIFLTRNNNIGFALVWPFIFILESKGSFNEKWKGLVLAIFSFVGMIAIFKVWPEAYNQHHPYQWVKGYLTMHVSWSDLCQRIEHILWGLDWGLIYTAPYILLGFLAVFFIKYPNKKYFICLMGVLLVNFYIIMIWGSQGGWYGYRYMIASAIPLFVMPIAMLIKNIEQNSRRKWTLLWIAIAVPPALSMICFEGNSTTLTLHSITQFFGRSDWGNNTYQVAVWQTMTNIHEIWQPLFKGGMYYVLYLLQVAGLSLGGDKMGVFVRYPIFEWKILIQTGMFYTMPFIIGFIFKKIQFRISKVR